MTKIKIDTKLKVEEKYYNKKNIEDKENGVRKKWY